MVSGNVRRKFTYQHLPRMIFTDDCIWWWTYTSMPKNRHYYEETLVTLQKKEVTEYQKIDTDYDDFRGAWRDRESKAGYQFFMKIRPIWSTSRCPAFRPVKVWLFVSRHRAIAMLRSLRRFPAKRWPRFSCGARYIRQVARKPMHPTLPQYIESLKRAYIKHEVGREFVLKRRFDQNNGLPQTSARRR